MNIFVAGLILVVSTWLFKQLQRLFKWIIERKGYKWFYWHIYLKMPSWKFARQLKFYFNGKQCKQCGGVKYLDVHHKSYNHKYYEWLFLGDIEVLCRNCHYQEHLDYFADNWQKAIAPKNKRHAF